MRRNYFLKSGLVVSILLLFGAIFAPAGTINSAIASADNECNNVIVTTFGMQHLKDIHMMLTKHQFRPVHGIRS
jgi:hypothetical protein